ncbi:MAG: M1 family metallopeptidase [Anaerolineales bacterium]|nr:M1 family metallopeptidase [Anaerolineales bacterium]
MPPASPTIELVLEDTAEPGITEAPIPTSNPAPVESAPPLSRYTISAVLDYDAHKLQVEQIVRYINSTDTELSEILLLVEPNRYPGGFSLDSFSWQTGEQILAYSLNDNELLLPLPVPLLPGETLEIHFAYTLILPNQNAPYGYTDRQTNLGDWYPYVPPYLPGEGWLVRPDAFLGEHLAYDMAEFEVEIQLAAAFSVDGGELIIAASSSTEFEDGVYHYRHAPARNFAWTVSDIYLQQETMAGDVLVKAYSFPFHPQADAPALEDTAKAVTIFGDIFEPYPHKTLSVVEADFLDGMEYDGLVFLSHAFYDYYTGDPQSNLTIIAAHEVAHQWWYGLVGNDQALEPWLDEALSTISEVLFYEQAYPDLVAWWWDNRIYFHSPQGWVDSTIYEPEGFYPYRDAVYLRGALFLGELRELLGEDGFQEFLREYLSLFRYRQVDGDDFFNLLSQHTSADISQLVSEYFANR